MAAARLSRHAIRKGVGFEGCFAKGMNTSAPGPGTRATCYAEYEVVRVLPREIKSMCRVFCEGLLRGVMVRGQLGMGAHGTSWVTMRRCTLRDNAVQQPCSKRALHLCHLVRCALWACKMAEHRTLCQLLLSFLDTLCAALPMLHQAHLCWVRPWMPDLACCAHRLVSRVHACTLAKK